MKALTDQAITVHKNKTVVVGMGSTAEGDHAATLNLNAPTCWKLTYSDITADMGVWSPDEVTQDLDTHTYSLDVGISPRKVDKDVSASIDGTLKTDPSDPGCGSGGGGGGGSPQTESFMAKVTHIDIDADTDRDGTIEGPRDKNEDAAEDSGPGAVIPINDDYDETTSKKDNAHDGIASGDKELVDRGGSRRSHGRTWSKRP